MWVRVGDNLNLAYQHASKRARRLSCLRKKKRLPVDEPIPRLAAGRQTRIRDRVRVKVKVKVKVKARHWKIDLETDEKQ